MEPPHHMFLGGASEECHSSESGWTMYIGSPIDDDDDDHEEQEDKYPYCYEGPDEVVESDDSMASDASSGPSHYYGVVRHDLQQKVLEEDQYGGGEDHEFCKGSTQIEEEKIKEKKKHEMGFVNNSSSKGKAPSSVQGGGKGRKNHWVGKRK